MLVFTNYKSKVIILLYISNINRNCRIEYKLQFGVLTQRYIKNHHKDKTKHKQDGSEI